MIQGMVYKPVNLGPRMVLHYEMMGRCQSYCPRFELNYEEMKTELDGYLLPIFLIAMSIAV